MPTLDAGESAKIVLGPSDSFRVTAPGQASVVGISGAPATTTTVTGATRDFGPYGLQAVLRVTSVAGSTNYGPVEPTPLSQNELSTVRNQLLGAGGSLDIGQLPKGTVWSHRLSGCMVAPENTRLALRKALTYGPGYVIDVGDYYETAQLEAYDIHNADLSQVTNLSGAMSSRANYEMDTCTITCGTWFPGVGVTDQTGAMSMREVIPLFKGVAPITPEPKTLKAAQIQAPYIASLGMQLQTIPTAFNDAWLSEFARYNFPYLARNVAAGAEHATIADNVLGPARCATLRNLGINYVVLDEADANFAAALAIAKAAGMKVGAYTSRAAFNSVLIKQYHKAQLDAAGVDFHVSDDPLFYAGDVARYRRTSDPWRLKEPGWWPGSHDRYFTRPPTTSLKRGVVGSDGLHDITNRDTQNQFHLDGWGCPLANAAASYTITATITLAALPADLTRWVALVVCCPDDRVYTDSGVDSITTSNNGYQIWVTMSNGTAATLNIARKTNGSGTNLGGTPIALSSTIGAGAVITLTVAVTPTTITATVAPVSGTTAAGTTGAIADTTWRGAFFHHGHAAIGSGTMTPKFKIDIA